MNYLKTTILGLAVALGSALLVQRGAAQGLVEACYVNKTGVLYVINQPGLPTECRSPGHTYVSWSQQGIQGPKGDEGTAGLSCWDLDGDGVQDPEEDVNGDQSFNALDCRGPQGLPGAAGMLGAVTFAAATNQVRPPSSFSTLLTTSFTTAADGPAVISFFANAAKLDGASEYTGLIFPPDD